MARLLRRYKSPIYGHYRRWYAVCGVLTGLLMGAGVFVSRIIGTPICSPETFLTDGLMAVGIFVSCYLYREHLPEQKVFFKELMLLGLGIGVVGGLVYGLLLALYSGVDGEFVGRCADLRIQALDDPESLQTKQAIDTIKGYSVGDWSFIGGFRSAVMSVILAFIAAMIFGIPSKNSPLNVTLNKK